MRPKDGYASISTVNMGFLNLGLNLSENTFVRLMSAAAPYAPMDGMNEKGLCVAVLMIEDRPGFDQNTEKPDLTTTTAIRLLLNKAANVDEALDLLRQYDIHASMGLMVHFAIGDNTGRGVVVEYVDNQMVVTETPVVTNFYLAEGSKHGIRSQQSHERYDILTQMLKDRTAMTVEEVLCKSFDVRAALRGNRVLYLEDGKPLDKLALPVYEADSAKERETQLNRWLSALQW